MHPMEPPVRPSRERKTVRRPLRIIGFALLVAALVVLGLLLFTHAF